jgi:GntR family transcriptional regulator, transcriptional repressor for pyruvate dehydrogenase complex
MPLSDKHTLLAPLPPARNRTTDVIERISAEIADGRLAPGARLPTEHELMGAMGVSRTVVREAVSALRSEGLVITRQGSGAFVSSDAARVPFRIDTAALSSIGSVIKLLELRLAIEVEAAALAAERASATGLKAIERALTAIDRSIEKGDAAISEDFAFHQAVANATNNELFKQFLSFLGRHVIPRQSIRENTTSGDDQTAYLTLLQKEHRDIAAAIRKRDARGARRAMRAHLENSLDRYRRIAGRASE